MKVVPPSLVTETMSASASGSGLLLTPTAVRRALVSFSQSSNLSKSGVTRFREFVLQRAQLRRVRRVFFLKLRQRRRRRADLRERLVAIVEKREELVIFALRNLIVFVRVAARAADCEPEPHRTRRLRAIEHRLVAELLLIHTALGIRERLPVKCRREFLLRRRIRQQVTRELLDGELV